MSSGTRVNTAGVARDIATGALPMPIREQDQQPGPTSFLSGRQQFLDHLFRYYRCANYDGRKVAWDGTANVTHTEHDLIATTGFVPEGFYMANWKDLPLDFRKPSAPYYIGKIIPDRFTAMLFSARTQPKIAADDPDTEDWLGGFIEKTRLWAQMIQARTLGGSMGSTALVFKLVEGVPHIEVLDPRYTTPVFSDRTSLTVKRCEVLYQYSDEVIQDDGTYQETWFWYRRIIDRVSDRVWPRVPVDGDKMPRWHTIQPETFTHDMGECPVFWIQNQPVMDQIDGDPDCHGIFDLIERISGLWSQADKATIATCDPSLVVASDAEYPTGIKKGSDNAIQVEKGGSITYLEINGTGIDKAISLAEKLEEKALTVARCMLDRNEGGPARSPEEVQHQFSAMVDQCDILREQYGEKGVKRLLEMVLRVAKRRMNPRIVTEIDENGDQIRKVVVDKIHLPKKKVTDEETGKVSYKQRVLGVGEQIDLVWPDYHVASQDEVAKKVDATIKAKAAGLLDQKHAVRHIAKDFDVENMQEMLSSVKREQKEDQELLMSMGGAMGGDSGGGGGGNPAPPGGWVPAQQVPAGM